MNLPSIKTIQSRLIISHSQAKAIRAILESKKSVYKTLDSINAILDAHGVEYIRHVDDSFDQSRGVDYINMGDSYTATIGFNYKTSRFFVSDIGSIVDRKPNDYI